MKVLTENDFKAPLSVEGNKLTAILNARPQTFTLGNPKTGMANSPTAPMKRLFVHPYTGQGFLRLEIIPDTDKARDIIDTTGLPNDFIRADAYSEDGARCWLQNKVIGYEGATVGKKYLFILHGFWNMENV